MIRLYISTSLLFCCFNFCVLHFVSAESSDTKKRTESNRKEKKKNRESRQIKQVDSVSFSQIEGLAPKGNAPQIEPNKSFRMSIEQIKGASLWVDRTLGMLYKKMVFTK